MPIIRSMRRNAQALVESAPSGMPPARVIAACADARAAFDATEPAQGLEGFLDALHEGLGGAYVAAFTVEHGHLWLAGMRGYPMLPAGVRFGQGMTGMAASTGEVRFAPDVVADEDYVEVAHDVVSELALPVYLEGDVVGVLTIETTDRLPPETPMIAASLAPLLGSVLTACRDNRALDLSALARLFVFIGSLREVHDIATVATRSLARIARLDTCQVALLGDGVQLPQNAWLVSADAPGPFADTTLRALRSEVDQSAVVGVVAADRVGRELADEGVHSAVVVPLRASGAELGVLVGLAREPVAFEEHHAEVAALLGAHVAASLDAALALARERETALTDPLTGLLNRRGMEQRLERDVELARLERRPLTVLVLDGDEFKQLNDRGGHEYGDAVLRELGLILGSVVEERFAARLGGDEFAVVLHGLDVDEALGEARTLLDTLGARLREAGFPITLSAGAATYPYDGDTASALLRAADQALYDAKAAGRNRAVSFRDVARGQAPPSGPTATRERRGTRSEAVGVDDVLEAAASIWAASDAETVAKSLARGSAFVLGATGAMVSLVDGDELIELADHSLRDIEIAANVAYLIDDFPVTAEVLATRTPRAISFLDDDVDRAEAFVLRDLGMRACLLVPICVGDRAWGLLEVYEQRLRRFPAQTLDVATFLATQAGHRLSALDGAGARRRRLPLFRLPRSQS